MSESDHRLLNEVKTFALLSNHPNVIRYYNAWIEPADAERDANLESDLDSESEDDEDFTGDHDRPRHQTTLFIQMQLCPYQDLRKWISSRDSIKLDTSLNIFWQIVSGLVHIHAQGVIHRDVKPENIFVHNDHVFLGDFGLAKNIQDHAIELSPQQSFVETFATSTEDGTFLYMAPEILASQVCTTKSDIYSLGVILFELLTHFDTVMERVVVWIFFGFYANELLT
jgi:translation initiation factor 2-alpha kinase 4